MTKELLTALLVNAAVFSVLFIIILAVRRLIGKRLSPALMLVLWAVVVIKLLIPYGFESDLAVLAAPQTVAAAPTDTSNGAPVPTDTLDSISFEESQTDSVISDNGSSSQFITQALPYQAKSPAPAATINWTLLAFGVWVAGVLAVAGVFGIGTVMIRRRMRHAQLRMPDQIRDVFEECKALLGIKHRIGIRVQSAFGMPIMMGAIRPCLVLPESAPGLDKKTLRHIMLHELSHWKRGDLLLIWTLNLLSAVYWFNPLTWLCFKLMRDDIETACDHSVFKIVGQDCRLDYIDTILHFAGSDKQQRLAAAMALSHRRSGMEKRIKGMFKAARTHMAGRCAALCVALLMLCASVFTACQPVKPVEMNKADGTVAAISRSAEPQYTYEAPARWSETVESEKLRIIFDNDIKLPDTNVYPVVKVEPFAFSQQQIDKMVNYFAGGEKLFLPHIRTKAEYDDEIADAKRGIVCGEPEDPENAQAYAQELEKKRSAAPDDSPIIYTDTTLTYERDEFGNQNTRNGKNYLYVCFNNDNGSEGVINVSNKLGGMQPVYFGLYNSVEMYMTESMYRNLITESGETEEEAGWVGAGALFDAFSVDKDKTLETAVKVLDDLGIKDLKLASYEKAVAPNVPDKSCYSFRFTRQCGGIPSIQFGSSSSFAGEERPDYSSPMSEENVSVLVSKDGIEGFSWARPSRVVETVTDNVKLLPFEDIQKAFKDRIAYRKSFYTRGYMHEKAEVKVTSVELRTAYIGEKDNADQALLVPAWVIESIFSYNNGSNSETYQDEIYVINAIDGGVIGPPWF